MQYIYLKMEYYVTYTLQESLQILKKKIEFLFHISTWILGGGIFHTSFLFFE
jgi:hypothetical protein